MFDPISLAILGGSALAKLFGAHKAATASTTAAKTQSDSAQKALDFNAMLFGQQQQAFQPYQDAGKGAIQNLGSLLTGARPPQMPASVQRVFGQPQMPQQAQSAAPSLLGPSQAVGKLVTLRSPDGEMGQVPEAQVQHWLSKGAQVVQ